MFRALLTAREACDKVGVVDEVIRARRTSKVLGNVASPVVVSAEFENTVNEIIEVAGHAPFHFAAHSSHRNNGHNSLVPWRFHVFNSQACNALIGIIGQFEEGRRKKLGRMLAAAGALVIVTWLPDPSQNCAVELTSRNVEHIAAASCATQNLLLAATARNIANYWSSGGVLRSPEVYAASGIPACEAFLGAIFLFPTIADDYDVQPGKLRHKRGNVGDWVSVVSTKSLRKYEVA